MERDLERALFHGPRLAHELVHATVVEVAVAIGVGVDSVGGAGNFAVEQNAERNRFTLPHSSQHEVDVACL
jgi:hypothetical protein